MKNLLSLKSIEYLHTYGIYKIYKLTFTNFKRYYITCCSNIIYKYDSEKWALKKYYSLVHSLIDGGSKHD